MLPSTADWFCDGSKAVLSSFNGSDDQLTYADSLNPVDIPDAHWIRRSDVNKPTSTCSVILGGTNQKEEIAPTDVKVVEDEIEKEGIKEDVPAVKPETKDETNTNVLPNNQVDDKKPVNSNETNTNQTTTNQTTTSQTTTNETNTNVPKENNDNETNNNSEFLPLDNNHNNEVLPDNNNGNGKLTPEDKPLNNNSTVINSGVFEDEC